MYVTLGALLTIIGVMLYAVIFWRNSNRMEFSHRLIFAEFGITVAVYFLLFYMLIYLHNLDMKSIGDSLIFAGIAFLFVDIGRSFVAGKIGHVFANDSKAYALSIVHLSMFEPNAIYIVLIFILGLTVMRENHMSYGTFNTAMLYVSLFSAISAVLMGVVMNRALEGVESFEDMRRNFRKTVIWTVSAHSVAIIGLVLAIYIMLPYLGK